MSDAFLHVKIGCVLKALAAGELAWRRSAEVAFAMGWGPASAEVVLEALEHEGLVERWAVEWRPDPWWTLTPLAAELLGLVLVESGPAELPRWQAATDPLPPVHQPRQVVGQTVDSDLFARCGLIPPPPPKAEPRVSKAQIKRRRKRARVSAC